MATEHAYVFCYDISSDRGRGKVAEMLEHELVRVQKSVFEGRMTAKRARYIADKIATQLHIGDSLRVYALTSEALDLSFTISCSPLPEKQPFLLF
jgi:CRISPR-associated protein Cas2